MSFIFVSFYIISPQIILNNSLYDVIYVVEIALFFDLIFILFIFIKLPYIMVISIYTICINEMSFAWIQILKNYWSKEIWLSLTVSI